MALKRSTTTTPAQGSTKEPDQGSTNSTTPAQETSQALPNSTTTTPTQGPDLAPGMAEIHRNLEKTASQRLKTDRRKKGAAAKASGKAQDAVAVVAEGKAPGKRKAERANAPRKAASNNLVTFKLRMSDKGVVCLGHAAIDRRMTRGDVLSEVVMQLGIEDIAEMLKLRYTKGEPATVVNPTCYNVNAAVISKLEELAQRTHLSVNYIVNLIAESL